MWFLAWEVSVDYYYYTHPGVVGLAPKAGFEPTRLAILEVWGLVCKLLHYLGSLVLSPYSCLSVYVAHCLRSQCRLLLCTHPGVVTLEPRAGFKPICRIQTHICTILEVKMWETSVLTITLPRLPGAVLSMWLIAWEVSANYILPTHPGVKSIAPISHCNACNYSHTGNALRHRQIR